MNVVGDGELGRKGLPVDSLRKRMKNMRKGEVAVAEERMFGEVGTCA